MEKVVFARIIQGLKRHEIEFLIDKYTHNSIIKQFIWYSN